MDRLLADKLSSVVGAIQKHAVAVEPTRMFYDPYLEGNTSLWMAEELASIIQGRYPSPQEKHIAGQSLKYAYFAGREILGCSPKMHMDNFVTYYRQLLQVKVRELPKEYFADNPSMASLFEQTSAYIDLFTDQTNSPVARRVSGLLWKFIDDTEHYHSVEHEIQVLQRRDVVEWVMREWSKPD